MREIFCKEFYFLNPRKYETIEDTIWYYNSGPPVRTTPFEYQKGEEFYAENIY